MKNFYLSISFFISLAAYSQDNFCSGEVKNFEIKKNEFFTGLCANNERSRGLTIYLEDSESNMAGAGFAGSYKNDMPFRGELLFDPENEDDPSYIFRGEFTGEGESLRFRGDIYYDEDFVSGGSHNDDFELDGYGMKVLYEGEFDYQMGIFADAVLVGNAMWTKKNSADVVYVKYTGAGRLTDKAYLELENGEEYTLNYRSNSYRSSSKGWTQNDRASAEIIKNALSTELDKHLRFREQIKKEIDQVIEEVNSLDTEIEESFVSLAGWGTGFYVNEDTVVTNNHVVESCQSVTGLLGFEEVDLRVVSTDPLNDLALMKTNKNNNIFATIRGRPPIRRGEQVVSVGYGYGEKGYVGQGVKVSEGRIANLSGVNNLASQFQMTAEIYGGNSGGPLFDNKGNVIGVSVSGWDGDGTQDMPIDATNLNFGIKSLTLINFLDLNQIQFKEVANNRIRQIPDIVSDAEKFTLLIRCYE